MLRSLREPKVAANPSQAVSRVDRCKPLARGEVGAGEGMWRSGGRGGVGWGGEAGGEERAGRRGRGGGGGEEGPPLDFEGSALSSSPPPPRPPPPPPPPLRVWHYAACSGRATQAAVLSPLPPPPALLCMLSSRRFAYPSCCRWSTSARLADGKPTLRCGPRRAWRGLASWWPR
jgi:hypothetical protein